MKKITTIKKILSKSPQFLTDFYWFYYDNNPSESQIRKINDIYIFLSWISNYFSIQITEINTHLLESLDVLVIDRFLYSGKRLEMKENSKKIIISNLQSFWQYFTIDSYSIAQGKPIFYRNVINEWKVFHQQRKYIEKSTKNTIRKNKFHSQIELMDFLRFIDFEFELTLTTRNKIINWKRQHDRDLAIVALVIGTGITAEEMEHLNLEQINLKEKVVIIRRNEEIIKIKILDFTLPYISEYVKWRQKYRYTHSNSLFLNSYNKRPSNSFYRHIVKRLADSYDHTITFKTLRDDYGKILFESYNGKYPSTFEAQKYKSITSLTKYLISS